MSQLALALGYGHTPEGRSVLLRRAPSVRIKERRNEQWRLRVGRRYKLSNTLAHKRAPLAPNLNVVQGRFAFQQNRAFFASPATPTLKFGAAGPKCCLIYIVNSTGVRLRWSSEAPCIGKQIGTHRGRCLRSGGMCRVSSVPCCVWCVQCLLSCVCVPVIPWTRRLSFKAPSSLPVGLGQPRAVHGGACLGRATATPSPGRARPGRARPGRARAGRARPAAFGPAAPSNTSLVWHRSARAGLAGPARACLPVLGRWGPTRAQLGPN